jgi:hypothetical protein
MFDRRVIMKGAARISLLVVLLIAFAGIASANTCAPRVDRREARQQARIGQGVRSGRLTPGETIRLERGQRRVDRAERVAKADGRVSPRERARLNRMQDRQSRRIYRLKHNGREL